jgi:predicted nucleotidyltransferase
MASGVPLAELLAVLERHGVRFIVVGGVAAVLDGAPVTTFDLDILHSRDPDNVSRLRAALTEVRATYRNDPRGLVPNESHLLGPGHQLLKTTLGDLDVLGTIEKNTTYEQALADSNELEIDGLHIRVLGLERLIAAKEYANRPKDVAVLPVLRATLEEIRRRGT